MNKDSPGPEARPRAWIDIWNRPTRTIQEINDYNPAYGLVPLSALLGFTFLLHALRAWGIGRSSSLGALIIIALLCAVPIGYLFITIDGWFRFWVGKSILGGRGTFKEVRAATGWGSIPNTLPSTVIWIILLFAYGKELFIPGSTLPSSDTRVSLGNVLSAIQSLFIIWSLFTTSHTLAGAHGFSSWKGLGTWILAGVIEGIIGLLLLWFIKVLSH